MVEKFAISLQGHHMNLIISAHIGSGKGLPYQRRCVGKCHIGQLEIVEFGAGRYACIARRHHNQLAAALNHHHAYAETLAYVRVHQPLAHKRTGIPHADIGKVQIAHQIVVFQ